jgi:hypothetical protein
MTEEDLKLAFNDRPYPRVIYRGKIWVDFDTLCSEIIHHNNTSVFRLLKKMDLANCTFNYKNRVYYLESFAYDFWRKVSELNL